VDYDRACPHSATGHLSPIDFESAVARKFAVNGNRIAVDQLCALALL